MRFRAALSLVLGGLMGCADTPDVSVLELVDVPNVGVTAILPLDIFVGVVE